MVVARRPSPKVYRVYVLNGHNYVRLGGKAWMVQGRFSKSKATARSRLESLRWRLRNMAGPTPLMRVVLTKYGWAVVSLSRLSRYQMPATALSKER